MDKKMKVLILFLMYVVFNDITLGLACLGLMNPIVTIIGHAIEFYLWFKIIAFKDNVSD